MRRENPVEFQRNEIKRNLTLVQYLLLSWHLIDVIKFDLNEHSVKKVASTLYHVMRREDSRGAEIFPSCRGQSKAWFWNPGWTPVRACAAPVWAE